ncbi:MAG: bifunctional 5,10-methylenetetrahydrofolate dehydrogenase/5,10-methenyltetrahydrofolate cyclohydrolase [Clostridia bacterium]|nr:bifunctional 5,10-methylenetetrahydrofolate dehydrogenase/5,10-methenyltetrahydrofolate cyclohydrolase [Clostridia bacterium]
MSTILDGKLISSQIKNELKNKCELLGQKYGITAKLAIILVGNDPASQIYVASKQKACEYVGIQSVTVKMDECSTQEQVINQVKLLAADKSVNGLMVQLPLPKTINESEVLNAIPPEKDVDGLTVNSGGLCFFGLKGFTPCTPKGIIEILTRYNVDFCKKHAVVIGRSNMVGKPIAQKLLQLNCTVTICHSKTQNLADFTKTADILVVAVGKKHLVTADMVKPGAIVVDVGINRENGVIYGDVDFNNVSKIASMITPVPGGIGPMTVAMLLSNTYEGCLNQNNLKDEFL